MLGHLEKQILLVVLGLQKHNEKAYGLLIFKKLKDMGVSLVNGSVYISCQFIIVDIGLLKMANLSSSIEVLVVKDGSRFLASNDITLSIQDIKLRYASRQLIEESFKILKFQLAWAKNPSHSKQAQLAHLHFCLMAFCCLEAESAATGLTPYSIRRSLFPGAVPTQSHLIQYFIQAA